MRVGGRVFNPQKFIANMMVILILVLAFAMVYNPVAVGNPSPSYREVVVHKGDTLWSIAREYCGEGTDIRQYLSELYRINHLDSPLIRPGQIIKVPLF